MRLRSVDAPDKAPAFTRNLPLFGGGPLDRVLERLGCAGCERNASRRRIIFFVALLWAPPFILAGLGGLLAAHPPRVGILADFRFHVRYLIAIPILMAAECSVQRGIGDTIPVLEERGIIRAEHLRRLARTEDGLRALRDSPWPEALLFAASAAFVLSRSFLELPPEITSWKNQASLLFVLARGWDHAVGLPLFYFLGARWVFKFLLWTAFLFRVAGLRPELQGQHPDHRGGLGFLIARNLLFALFVLALSSVISANIGAAVLYAKADLEEFTLPFAGYLAFVELVFLLPLLAFTPALLRARWEALVRYGNFANRYVHDFGRKWLEPAVREAALGANDIQALNDLMGSYASTEEMVPILASRRGILGVTFFAVLPFVPLLLFKVRWVDLISLVATVLR